MEDVHIIQLFWERSEAAIAALAEKYGKLLYQIAVGILWDPHDAEECQNDTYLRTWNTVPPHRPGSLKAYTSRIVRNLSLDRLRYRNRKKRGGELELVLSELDQCIPDPMANVEAAADDTLRQALNHFLGTLNPQTRVLFLRRYFCMESTQELADRYGLTASNVSTKLNRVRCQLRQYLEREGWMV
ncbi:MAG: sigma-70 family RNA polymerase sigma factor [Lachnospiraceae bacterium]|nr:sigma-70 family RNA polymerase sigma factor [Lachnospiraceae bacterium]